MRTGKARSAIRHHLRTINLSESVELGQRLLSQALAMLNLNPVLAPIVVDRLLNESSAKSMDEIYADIGVGKRMATLVARHIMGLLENEPLQTPLLDMEGVAAPGKMDPVVIYGSEGVSVQLSPCCQPIPGDHITGQLKRDQGLVVHTEDCHIAKRQRNKDPDRWIEVLWGEDLNRRFDCRIKVLVHNDKGILARVAAEIGDSDANIIYVNMDDDKDQLMTQLIFTIQVEDRVHLARLMRNVRRIRGVTRILRDRNA